MTERVTVKPEILHWACERVGHDLDAYAARFPRLPAWARGEKRPTLKQLESFARATHTPIGFFFLTEPPEERVPIADFRTVSGRHADRPSPDLLDTIYICQQRQEWYRDFARSTREPTRSFVGSANLTDDPVVTAGRIRDTLCFEVSERARMSSWTDALRYFINQADAAGILVMCNGVVHNNTKRKLDPDEFRGFAMADDLAPLVFVNGADTKAAQMFTLAHELSHLWLGESGVSDSEALTVPSQRVERWCNQVGAELLVPLASVKVELRQFRDVRDEAKRLAGLYKVSTLVILRRMHDAGAIDGTRFRQEYARELGILRAVRKGSGGNFYLTLPMRVSKRFARALVVSTLEGHTLHRDAFRMLGFKKHDTFQELGRTLGVI